MAGISTDSFFKLKRNSSEIKSEIFVKYFKFWCGVLLFAQKYKTIDQLLYIDLFSGPGRYANGDSSTPIKILDSVIASKNSQIDLDKSVRTFFNDEKKKLVDTLEKHISSLTYFNQLTHKPVILNKSVSKDLLSQLLRKGVPSLTFIDPFGYSYSMEILLNSVKEWGSDLFMLFNINRIRAAIMNPVVEGLMNEIFQQELQVIRSYYAKETNPYKREEFIISKFENLFKNRGYLVFKFRIYFPSKDQTSHYLYLVSKVKLAYLKIKEIMKIYSDYQPDGVPLFSANTPQQNPIFYPELEDFSIHHLERDLISKKSIFNNKTVEIIYSDHCINTNYIKENYKSAFANLHNNGKIKILNIQLKESSKLTYTSTIIFN